MNGNRYTNNNNDDIKVCFHLRPFNCNESPLKQAVLDGLNLLSNEIKESIHLLNNGEDNCILCNLESIKDTLNHIESVAGSFYLKCYLANYTDKFEEIATCMEKLSAQRIGALIVIEREDPLDQLIQKGTDIGAILTPALLESIFYPGSPLHDGAVLIRQNKIISAANFLPMATEIFEGSKFGARHRAAIGLTEHSDALVLVVSEETGKISFALNGNLYPIQTMN